MSDNIRYRGDDYDPMPPPIGIPEVDRRNYAEWIRRGRARAATGQSALANPARPALVQVAPQSFDLLPAPGGAGGGALVPPGGGGVPPVGPGGSVGFPRASGGVPAPIPAQEYVGRVPIRGRVFDVAPVAVRGLARRAMGPVGFLLDAGGLERGAAYEAEELERIRNAAADAELRQLAESELAASGGAPRRAQAAQPSRGSSGSSRSTASRTSSRGRSRSSSSRRGSDYTADELNAASLRSTRGEAEPSERTKAVRANIDRRRRELESERPRMAKGGTIAPPKVRLPRLTAPPKAKLPRLTPNFVPRVPNPAARLPRPGRAASVPKIGKRR